MNSPHLRPSRLHQSLYASEIPAGQARALERRQVLEARQRAFREIEAGPPTTSAADLAPVRRRTGGARTTGLSPAPGESLTGSPGSDESGGHVDVEVGDLARPELGQGDRGHGGVVGAERRRRDEQLDAQLGRHRADPVAEAPVRGHAAADAQPRSRPIRAGPDASWRPGHRRRPPESWRPGRRSPLRRAGSRGTGRFGRGARRARPSSGRRS